MILPAVLMPWDDTRQIGFVQTGRCFASLPSPFRLTDQQPVVYSDLRCWAVVLEACGESITVRWVRDNCGKTGLGRCCGHRSVTNMPAMLDVQKSFLASLYNVEEVARENDQPGGLFAGKNPISMAGRVAGMPHCSTEKLHLSSPLGCIK